MAEQAQNQARLPGILLVMTFVTGIVDAVSFLGLGHVFTANMTGNIVFLGFAIGGASGLSILHSLLALFCFGFGALVGGRMMLSLQSERWAPLSMGIESLLLLIAAAVAFGSAGAVELDPGRQQGVIVATAIAMGLRNAVVRKLAVPDLTTTVLTLTVTGLAADSGLAGGANPRWQRRGASIVAMLGGAILGAALLRQSAALPLLVCSVVAAGCMVAAWRASAKRDAK